MLLELNNIALKIFAPIAIILLIAGCSTPKTKQIASSQTLPALVEQNPENLLTLALNAPPKKQAQLYLQAANLYWNNNRAGNAKASLQNIQIDLISENEIPLFIELSLSIALLEEDIDSLRKLTNNPEQTLNLKVPTLKQRELLELFVDALIFTQQNVEAAVLLTEYSGLLPAEDIPETNKIVWDLLKASNISALNQYSYLGDNYDVKGWLSLATTFKRNQINLERQHTAITEWLEKWQNHPASIAPPREIQLLTTLPEQAPKHLTLALPLTGRYGDAGKAVRDGFLAAYYQDSAEILDISDIQIFDTSLQDIEYLYDQESSQNSLIVGPLDKPSIAKIAKLDDLPTKTLALNYFDHNIPKGKLFQFGLQPEAGAHQLAERLNSKGLKKVAIIAPEAEWGFKIHDSFIQEFIDKKGIIIESVFYQDQKTLASSVAKLLATDEGKQRAKNLKSISGLRFDYEPHRRNDIDAIFIIAKPKIAKQLKPLLAFHFASNIPTLSSSQIHDPNSKNHDLNGIEFLEMPWMLSHSNSIKHEISALLPETMDRYSRFYALGVDAFSLVPRLALLKEIQGSQIEGQTGTLSIDPDGIVIRNMQWAKFKKGNAIAIQE